MANCEVSYSSPAAVIGQVTVSLIIGSDYGGLNWTVIFDDGGAGGSFGPPEVTIGDPTSGLPTTAQTTYTAPATPQTVTFDWTEPLDNGTGTELLSFFYSPSTLIISAVGLSSFWLNLQPN